MPPNLLANSSPTAKVCLLAHVSSSQQCCSELGYLPAMTNISKMPSVSNGRRHPTLKEVLTHKGPALDCFRQWLTDQLALENLLFFEAAEEYRKLESPQQRRLRLLEIYDTFIKDGAEYEMHVSAEYLQTMLDNIQNPAEDLLLNLQMDSWVVLSNDCYPKFLQSEDWKYFLG